MAKEPWSELSMDFIFGLPRRQGQEGIPLLKKWLTLSLVKKEMIHHTLQSCFFDKVIRLHGIPRSCQIEILNSFLIFGECYGRGLTHHSSSALPVTCSLMGKLKWLIEPWGIC